VIAGLALLVVAAALLAGGAEVFAANAAGAGRRLGVTALAIGLLLAGAEPEELLTAVIAALDGRPDLAAGDAIGANITMLTFVLGLAAVFRPVPISRRVRGYCLGAAAVGGLAALLLRGGVTRVEGAGLVAAYAVLVAVVWRAERQPPSFGELAEVEEEGDEVAAAAARSPRLSLLLAILGIAVMTGGGRVAITGAARVVQALDARDSVVGLTLLALATTAELMALVWASARHDVSDIAVAGVVGSAAYNATATLGVAALAAPLARTHLGLAPLAAAGLPLLVAGLGWRGRLPRWAGALLLAAYATYLVLVLR
jgi:cation:H+ antiporter